MARIYLENKKFYVVNEDKLVYKVGTFEAYDGYDTLHFNLELVAGWDYVNPDMNDIQGWCPADRFVEDVQSETLIHYMMEESLKESLEANDYTILENISADLQKIIDQYNEE